MAEITSSPSQGKRQFAQMKTNISATEMRTKAMLEIRDQRQQSSDAMEDNGPPSPSSEFSTALTVAAPQDAEIYVAPINYEELVKSKKESIESDPLKELLIFPKDDLKVESKPREFRTVRSALPKHAEDPMLPTYMIDLFKFYKEDWHYLHREFFDFSKYPKIRKGEKVDIKKYKIEVQKYELDTSHDERPSIQTMFQDGTSSLNVSEAEERILDYLKQPSSKDEKDNTLIEHSKMLSISKDLDIDTVDSVEDRPIGMPYKENFGKRFLIECISLTIGNGQQVEPLFGCLALYDLQSKKKISEDFHFDTNPPEIMDLLSKHSKQKDLVTLSKEAVFQVNYPNQEIYLILKIDKVLEGEIDPAYDRYSSSNKPDKISEASKEFCERLGKYRQPFAWCAIPLFNKEGSLEISLENNECSMQPLFRFDPEKISDDELMTSVQLVNVTKGTKKFKTVPGSLKVKISEIQEQPTNCLTPSLVPVKPFHGDSNSKLRREIEEFPQHPIVHPHIDYVNSLYVYPVSVNFSKYSGPSSARNIAIRVQFVPNYESSDPNTHPMKAIYGKSSSNSFVSEMILPVTFHNKSPTFHDEVKIALPLNLSKNHHIVFTFIHVSCKSKKGSEQGETILGYSWLPVFDGKIVGNQEHNLPIALELEKHYDVSKNIKYLDSKKSLFHVKTKLVSSVYTHDEKLQNFFNALQDLQRSHSEENLIKTIVELKNASSAAIVQFSAVIFDELFKILALNFSSEEVNKQCFRTIVEVVSIINSEKSSASKRDINLVAYVQYRFSNQPNTFKFVFQEIIKYWSTSLEVGESSITNLSKFSWFFFEIIIKSIVQYLKEKHEWTSGMSPDPKWLGTSISSLEKLVNFLIDEIPRQYENNFPIAKELNESVAYFLTDTVAFIERNFIFKAVRKYCDTITFSDPESLIFLKFDFLKIICGYEHFIQLNLPVKEQKLFEENNVLKEFWSRHYLAGTLLHEISMAIDSNIRGVRTKALTVIRDLLCKTETDPRYDTKEKSARVAGLFFPYIPILVEHHEQFKEDKVDDQILSLSEKRLCFISLIWILKNIEKKWIVDWLRKESQDTLKIFFDILSQCTEVFQYPGKEKIIERKVIMSTQRMSLDSRPKNDSIGPKSINSVKVSSRDSTSITKTTSISKKPTQMKLESEGSISKQKKVLYTGTLDKRNYNSHLDSESEIRLEGFLAAEISYVLAEVFEVVLKYQNPKTALSQESTDMFRFLIQLLEKNQSEAVIIYTCGVLKNFIFKYSEVIFKEGTIFCSELCRVVMRFCSSMLPTVRQHASSLLYLLFKKNYEATQQNNFMKTRVQTTVGLSKLNLQEDQYLRRSLSTIVALSQEDKSLNTTKFPEMIKDAAEKLFLILRDSVTINQHQYDVEMLADMHYRIAKGYMNAPDLRVANLETLYKMQFASKNWAEAAFGVLHNAALVAQCLKTMSAKGSIDMTGLPNGARDFAFISDNFLEEEASSVEGEGTGEPLTFSERGLIQYLEQATNFLRKAQLFETINEVYKLLIPIYEKNRNFEQLSNIHFQLYKDFNLMIQLNSSGKRILGTYYRVAFFGSLFKELDGQEFVYKERAITPLAEISNRLEDMYSNKFGADNFEIIRDSDTVNRNDLKPNKAYVQITYCEAYFDEEESKKRITYFERNNKLKFFVYETPYTPSKKSHGSVEEQHKRKTILEVERSFPYMKKRIPVIRRKEIIQTPIEVSIEAVSNRNSSLRAAVEANPPDPKSLQVLLQGSVRLQVNSGPLEIVNTFLAPEKQKNYSEDMIRQLKELFKEFLHLCDQALITNKKLIKPDQHKYQEDLQEGFEDLKKKVWPLVSEGTYVYKSVVDASKVNVLNFISGYENESSETNS